MYTIRLTDVELRDILSAIVDAKAANQDMITRHVAAGQMAGLDYLIDRDTSYQHIFNLVLYAHRERGDNDEQ